MDLFVQILFVLTLLCYTVPQSFKVNSTAINLGLSLKPNPQTPTEDICGSGYIYTCVHLSDSNRNYIRINKPKVHRNLYL